MKTFLEYVAEDIIQKYGTNLSRTAVVFPNKRAALFLNEHLVRLAGKPIWSPAYITISELFRRHTMGPQRAAKLFLQRCGNASSYEVTLYGSLAACLRALRSALLRPSSSLVRAM